MLGKRFEEVSGEDIAALINEGVEESQYIEYKREPWGNSSAERKECLYDITAFANAYGGDIIIGIDTRGHKPVSIVGLTGAADLQSDIQKRAIAGVDPRIPGLQIHPIPTSAGDVLLIRIPRSSRSPHMVTIEGTNKFYRRHGKDKLLMSVDEIGDAFLVTGQRVDRGLDLIARHQAAAPAIADEPLLCLASLPLLHYPRPIDVTEEWASDFLAAPPSQPEIPGWSTLPTNGDWQYYEVVPTLEGLVKRWRFDRHSYQLTLSRNGLLSFRTSRIVDPNSGKMLIPNSIIDTVVHFLRATKALTEYLGFQGEVASYLTLANVMSLKLPPSVNPSDWRMVRPGVRESEMQTIAPEPITWSSASEPDSVANRLLNIVYNAFHYRQAPLFTAGRYDPTATAWAD